MKIYVVFRHDSGGWGDPRLDILAAFTDKTKINPYIEQCKAWDKKILDAADGNIPADVPKNYRATVNLLSRETDYDIKEVELMFDVEQ